MKGPAIFLAQFVDDAAPFNALGTIAGWAASLGYRGVQIPTWDSRLIDLERAAESKTYCDEIAGVCRDAGVEITELSTHLQGQLVAVHPAYGEMFDAFAPEALRGEYREVFGEFVETRPSPARCCGTRSTRGRSGRPVSSRPVSTSWRAAGGRCWMRSRTRASMPATNCIRARTCTTA